MVREFARTEVAPVARELDRTSAFPWENIRKMGELGLLGVPWPEELGGAGMDQLSYYITIHELAKVDASHALTISAHTNLGTSPIVDFGTAGAEAPVRAAPRLGPRARRLRTDRAGRRQRRRWHRDDRGGQGRPLPAQRLQDLHHPRRGRRDLRGHRPHRRRARATRGITSFIVTKDSGGPRPLPSVGVGHDAESPAHSRGSGPARRKTRWAGGRATPAS